MLSKSKRYDIRLFQSFLFRQTSPAIRRRVHSRRLSQYSSKSTAFGYDSIKIANLSHNIAKIRKTRSQITLPKTKTNYSFFSTGKPRIIMLNILCSTEIGRCMSYNFVNEYGHRKVDKNRCFSLTITISW